MPTLLDKNTAVITSQRGFLVFVAIVLAVLAMIRAFLFPGVGGDDGEQLVFSQYFSWGYQLRNPPLVTWLLIGLQEITGPSVFSIVLLRGLILFGIYALSLGIATHLLTDRRLATLSAGSLMMIFFVGWNTIHGFTHTALVTLFYLTALFLLLRLEKAPSVWGRVLFGAALGLGLLAKYSFLIFAIALLVAALRDRDLRRGLLSPWVALGFALTLPLVVPQLAWLAEHVPPHHLVQGEAPLSWLENARRIAKSALRLALSIVGFMMPVGVIWLAVFWKAVRAAPPATGETARRMRFLERLFLVLVVAALVAIAVIQSDRLRSHYLFVLVPLVPYFFLRYGAAMTATEIRRFAALISVSGITLIGVLTGKYFIEPLVCGHCEDHVPYDDFARQVRDAGFRQGTIFAFFHKDPLAGNFRVRFPDSRVVSAKHPDVVAPQRPPPGQCLIIWPVKGAVEPKSATIDTANRSPLATNLPFDHPSRVISAPLPPYGKRPHALEYLLIDAGIGECR